MARERTAPTLSSPLPADWGAALTAWFHRDAASWPWRERRTVYGSWVAEVMSQQTTLAVVEQRWRSFLGELEDVESLARCDDDLLRRLWAGLGYYARARNLRAGAVQIATRGSWPNSYTEWLEIKGCGPYTAAVLASLHCGEAVACVDGNVVRVVARLLDLAENTFTVAGQAALRQAVDREIARAANPGAFNEALMELGQRLCRKTRPACQECPLRPACAAHATNRVAHSPPPRPRRPRVAVELAVLVLCRPNGEVGLWLRPRGLLCHTKGLPLLHPQEATAALEQLAANGAFIHKAGKTVRHAITHRDLTATVWRIELPARLPASVLHRTLPDAALEWVEAPLAGGAVASSLDRKALLAATVPG